MSIKIKFKAPTWLKTEPKQSSDLANNQKIFFSGEMLRATDVSPGAKQHTLVTLEQPKASFDNTNYLETVYIYTPHISFDTLLDNRFKKLDIPYFSQLDNATHLFGAGSRQCNLTSCAMFLAGLKPELVKEAQNKGFTELESYYGEVLNRYGDTTSHEANTKALLDFGVESYFSYTLSLKDLLTTLKAGYPVVMGVAYKASGHMVVATGFDLDKNHILIHDPYGIRYGYSDSYDVGAYAAYDPYSFETLENIWIDMGSEAGWGRIPTKIDGKPTGLSYNL